ncbi:MAG: LysR family transcriptional regulator [Deltaproteobacteria bacterium]|nr:MAG: LysR family transcriptional regulator [Deltaproteobacteria bacterium]
MINLNQFRIFYYAAKHLNFTRAAEELFISQPAITVQVKAFESACGIRLFKKRGRKIWLTDEGRTLFELARKVFVLEKEIERAVEDMRHLKRGLLRIGTTKAYARYFMPSMLSSFLSKHPEIKIELNEGSSLDMTRSLLDFKNEVAIVARTGDVPGIKYIPFSQEEMTIVLAPDHPFLKQKAISFADLATEPFIMKEIGSGTRQLVDQLFKRENCRPNILMETSNTEFIKQLVQRGDGVSFLVKEVVSLELSEHKLAEMPLNGQTQYMDVSIAYLENQPLSLPARAFLDTLENLQPYPNLSSPGGIGTILARMLAQRRKGNSGKGAKRPD